jgi:flagellar hook assembly protein FlgD
MIRNNGNVTLKIYDILGREVKTVVNSYLNAGKYKTTFDGNKMSSGLYFYKLKTEGFEETKKFILLK